MFHAVFVIQASLFFSSRIQHIKSHIPKRLCVCKGHCWKSCDSPDKRAKSVTRRDIYWQPCVCSCLCQVCVREARRLLDNVKWRWGPDNMAVALWPVPWLTHHVASWRQRTFRPWWVLTPVTFGCRQDPLTWTGLSCYLFKYFFLFLFWRSVLFCSLKCSAGPHHSG